MSEYNRIMSQTMRQMIDNDETVSAELAELVGAMIRDGLEPARTLDAETYGDYYENRNYELVSHVRDTVRDYVHDLMAELPAGFARDLALDLIDYGNAYMWEDVAGAYLPSVDDYAEWVSA